jgi:hypothetical protein
MAVMRVEARRRKGMCCMDVKVGVGFRAPKDVNV